MNKELCEKLEGLAEWFDDAIYLTSNREKAALIRQAISLLQGEEKPFGHAVVDHGYFVGRAEALLELLESDFGQSDRWVRIEAIRCEFEAYYSQAEKNLGQAYRDLRGEV